METWAKWAFLTNQPAPIINSVGRLEFLYALKINSGILDGMELGGKFAKEFLPYFGGNFKKARRTVVKNFDRHVWISGNQKLGSMLRSTF